MVFRIVIPQAFENMEEATIGAWRKREGDSVQLGDPLCELITEKTTFDLPAEAEGTLLEIVVPEKSIVPVQTIIALVGDPSEARPDARAENAALQQKLSSAATDSNDAATGVAQNAASLSVPPLSVPSGAGGPGASAGGTRVRATPAARRAAKDAGVAIEDVAARFPGKVLSEEDVRAFAQG
jgi:pyruvate dehydrogenase E2 component (dihydrolipoamide acetyltransferase)